MDISESWRMPEDFLMPGLVCFIFVSCFLVCMAGWLAGWLGVLTFGGV